MTVLYEKMSSPVGELVIVASDVGLRAVLWPADIDRPKARVKLDDKVEGTNAIIAAAKEQLVEYFAGTRLTFSLPLDLVGTDLQKQTWLALADIPYGHTTSYGEQAAALGRPTSVRAVAGANGKNPISIVLPCHRVVGADGSLTGFAGGLDAKSWLLDHERRHLASEDR